MEFDPEVGTGTNQIVPFATGVGANVETPTDWEADLLRAQGFQNGIADPTQCNTVMRQASFIAAMIAQFSADYSGSPALDDGEFLQAEQNFVDALRKLFRGVFFITDTGTADAMVGTTTPVPTAYDTRMLIVVKKTNANNTGQMTANFWGLGAVALNDNTGAPLSADSLLSSSYYILTFDGGSFRVLGGVAQYTSVTNLTANSGDMIAVATGSGIVDFRTLRGTHDAVIKDLDRWPRGDASTDIAEYVTSLELLSWIQEHFGGGGSLLNIQFLTASGTYTKTAGANKALIFATGGGAGGRTVYVTTGGYVGSIGGGAGSTAIAYISLNGITTISYTIGAGGNAEGNGSVTTFGSYASAGGGFVASSATSGAKGGIATVGQMLIPGGMSDSTCGGGGGASFWGGGGSDTGASGKVGHPANTYGAGGGGGNGGSCNGKSGCILVVEFS